MNIEKVLNTWGVLVEDDVSVGSTIPLHLRVSTSAVRWFHVGDLKLISTGDGGVEATITRGGIFPLTTRKTAGTAFSALHYNRQAKAYAAAEQLFCEALENAINHGVMMPSMAAALADELRGSFQGMEEYMAQLGLDALVEQLTLCQREQRPCDDVDRVGQVDQATKWAMQDWIEKLYRDRQAGDNPIEETSRLLLSAQRVQAHRLSRGELEHLLKLNVDGSPSADQAYQRYIDETPAKMHGANGYIEYAASSPSATSEEEKTRYLIEFNQRMSRPLDISHLLHEGRDYQDNQGNDDLNSAAMSAALAARLDALFPLLSPQGSDAYLGDPQSVISSILSSERAVPQLAPTDTERLQQAGVLAPILLAAGLQQRGRQGVAHLQVEGQSAAERQSLVLNDQGNWLPLDEWEGQAVSMVTIFGTTNPDDAMACLREQWDEDRVHRIAQEWRVDEGMLRESLEQPSLGYRP